MSADTIDRAEGRTIRRARFPLVTGEALGVKGRCGCKAVRPSSWEVSGANVVAAI